MGRVKEIQDKVNAPKLDKNASKRFVKSALWQAAQNKVKGNRNDSSFRVLQVAQLEQYNCLYLFGIRFDLMWYVYRQGDIHELGFFNSALIVIYWCVHC